MKFLFSDGIDNDGDGKIDLDDGGCDQASDASEIAHDRQCDTPEDPSESPPCSDGVDNDGDGLVDALELADVQGDYTVSHRNPHTITGVANGLLTNAGRPNITGTILLGRGSFSNRSGNITSYVGNSAEWICNQLGYPNVVRASCASNTVTHKFNGCRWNSPGDNHMVTIAANGQPSQFTAGERDFWLATLVCGGTTTDCSDGIDNDGDGLIDSSDGGCENDLDKSEVQHDPTCKDKDGDDEAMRAELPELIESQ